MGNSKLSDFFFLLRWKIWSQNIIESTKCKEKNYLLSSVLKLVSSAGQMCLFWTTFNRKKNRGKLWRTAGITVTVHLLSKAVECSVLSPSLKMTPATQNTYSNQEERNFKSFNKEWKVRAVALLEGRVVSSLKHC